MKNLLKCQKCGKYTMYDICCNAKCVSARPAKFSINDPYGEYRRKAKRDIYKQQGLCS